MKITALELSGRDERGYTCEYVHERSGKQLIVYRKAGAVSGRHYHKGISATKNPEIIIILHGSCRISWRHIDETELESAVVTGPVKLEVPPNVWHELVMETDSSFLELNSLEEHKADTFYLQ